MQNRKFLKKTAAGVMAFAMAVSGMTMTALADGTGEWREENGKRCWYENGVKQGTEGRGKEIFDPASDAWYWLDAPNGVMAVSKDVYQDSLAGVWGDYIGEDGELYGKWVRYDENGHMVKGWQITDEGTYFFDETFGTMAKGYATIEGTEYYFNPETGVLERKIGEVPEFGWKTIDGKDYWYENYVRQGYSVDASYRGKEIFDPATAAWYWLDNVQGGAKAVSKDVYQESDAGQWADRADGTGKWVRYDAEGHMIKGWSYGDSVTYYFDPTYGTMAKGDVVIEGKTYRFDTVTGIFDSEIGQGDAESTWKQQRETEHFVFYCEDGDVKALDDLGASFEGCYERVTSDLGKAPSGKTPVNIYPDLKIYHEAIGRPDAPDWSVGQAKDGSVYMVSPLNPGPEHDYDSIITVAVHEYVHIVVAQFNRRQPTYLNEGIACYEAGQRANINLIKYDMENGNLPSLTALERLSGSASYTYGPAYINFVVKTFGFDKVISQLEGKTQSEIFGMSTEQLNEKWIDFLKHYED